MWKILASVLEVGSWNKQRNEVSIGVIKVTKREVTKLEDEEVGANEFHDDDVKNLNKDDRDVKEHAVKNINRPRREFAQKLSELTISKMIIQFQ
ncbi:hypothetical protein M8J77_004440 [Diaphorina citri]|nr:hypothetical protein M8J77_004440 [Diaphorina citri]